MKLQLLERPIWPSPNWPALDVYGVKDSMCQQMGFPTAPLGRSRWTSEPRELSRDIAELDDKL